MLHRFTEVEDDLIKSHVSKGTDRQAFATLSKLFNRDRLSVYKRFKWLCEHQDRQGNVPNYIFFIWKMRMPKKQKDPTCKEHILM